MHKSIVSYRSLCLIAGSTSLLAYTLILSNIDAPTRKESGQQIAAAIQGDLPAVQEDSIALGQETSVSPEEAFAFLSSIYEMKAEKNREWLLSQGGRESSNEWPADDLTRLDPNLVGSMDRELTKRIRSGSIHSKHINNAVEIAKRTNYEPLRSEIIVALGRRGTVPAQAALRALYNHLQSDDEKSRILSLIKPKSVTDAAIDWLLQEKKNAVLSSRTENDILVNILMASLRDDPTRKSLSPELLVKLEPADRDTVVQIFKAVRQG